MSRLNLRLLGDFEARLGSGRPLRLRARKTQALLAYLASPPGQVHSRDKLASLLWGDSSQSQARSRLRGSLFILRKTLAPANPPCLALDGEGIALHIDAVDVDVVAFGRLVNTRDPEALGKAVELYRGDLLEGVAFRGALFEEWLIAERERLRELAVDALAKLLAHQRSAGAFEAAMQTGLRLVALDPLQESVHRTLMRLYAELGRRTAALRQYQMCVRVLQRELGVEPEAETNRLYRELIRRRPKGSAKAPGPGRPHKRPDAGQPFPDWLGMDRPLIGRETERAQLQHVLEKAAQSHGSVIAVVGEAGIGKTSLLGALAADVIAKGAVALLGRCYESASILPFGPWVDALRSGQTLDEEVLDDLRPVWRSELARLLPEADIAGLPAPSNDQLRLFEGVTHLVERLAARRPLVLMFVDIHWADEMSLRLLAFVSRRIAGWRVLLLATARKPELVDASMARRTLEELGRELHATSLELAPLSRHATDLLVRSRSRVSRDAAALTRLEEQVWAVSEGNPFVAVESIRALHEGSLVESSTTLPLPTRVRDLIADRLGRLSDRARQLAAVAAVIGREFDFALLQRASGCDEASAAEGVEELVRRGVLEGTDDQFDFTHDRIRAVISAELLLPQRKLLHRQIGTSLEVLYADDLQMHCFALGTHYRAGEAWDKAVHYLWQAARIAAARSAPREARGCFEQALGALAALPESPSTLEQGFEIRFELRPILGHFIEIRRVLELLREAEVLAERLNDDRRRGQVSAVLTNAHSHLGQLDEALATGIHALNVAERLGDMRLRLLSTTYLEQAHFYRGEYERVVELATHNIEALPADWLHESLGAPIPISIYDRYRLIQSLAQLGRFAEAARYEAEALRLAEATRHQFTIGMVHDAASRFRLLKGDWEQARSGVERWVAIVRMADSTYYFPSTLATSAWLLARVGETTESLARLREGEQAIERHVARGYLGTVGWTYYELGRAALVLGNLNKARHLGDCAVSYSPSHSGSAAHAMHLLGDIATHAEKFDAENGEAYYRNALALAEPRGMRPLVANCHLGLGRIYRRTETHEPAHEHLSIATTMYREMGMTYWLEQAEAELQAPS